MRAAAILGPGDLARRVAMFQRAAGVQWTSLIEQADVVVIFGGDGTIHRHLSNLRDLGTPVLLAPCGSGNDFARALGLRSIHDAVVAWRRYEAGGKNVRTIDLGIIREGGCPLPGRVEEAPAPNQNDDHYFCCVAGVGIDTKIAHHANALPK